MGCNLGIGKVCLSTHDPVGRIIGARTHGRLMNFSVELCLMGSSSFGIVKFWVRQVMGLSIFKVIEFWGC